MQTSLQNLSYLYNTLSTPRRFPLKLTFINSAFRKYLSFYTRTSSESGHLIKSPSNFSNQGKIKIHEILESQSLSFFGLANLDTFISVAFVHSIRILPTLFQSLTDIHRKLIARHSIYNLVRPAQSP